MKGQGDKMQEAGCALRTETERIVRGHGET
jgi:hypothetical protein